MTNIDCRVLAIGSITLWLAIFFACFSVFMADGEIIAVELKVLTIKFGWDFLD